MERILKMFLVAAAMCTAAALYQPVSASVSGHRQYYSNWSYRPSSNYYYTRYFYRPTVSYPTYSYHYCIHYPSQPRYVYYYNPHSQQYWGRFDCEGKEGEQYSILKPEDRKEKLEDIDPKAFPAPAAMPEIPESTDGTPNSDGEKIVPIKSLPDLTADPADLPGVAPEK